MFYYNSDIPNSAPTYPLLIQMFWYTLGKIEFKNVFSFITWH